MKLKRSIVSIFFILIFVLCTGCDSLSLQPKAPVPEEEVSITYPPTATVYVTNKGRRVSAYEVSWAYALNEKEWCSVKTNDPIHPLDQDFAGFLQTDSANGLISISFPPGAFPDEVGYTHYYDECLWLPGENDEDLRIKEKIERQRDYETFTELEATFKEDGNKAVVIDATTLEGGVYDIEFAWDRPEYRGTAKYCFLVKRRD